MKKMISRRNFLKVAGASAAALGLAACGGSSSSTAASTASSTAASAAPAAAGKVYYLNFKPEQDQDWQDLAAEYTKETGVPVTVVTAASGQYETTLMSEMEKSEAPTLFQVNGPVGLANWKDYCLDLSDSKLYGELTSDSFALKDGDAVTSIAYVIETYGIIYNKELLTAAGYTQDDIKGFDDLKKVADDIQPARLSWALMVLSPPPAWTVLPTGASRPIWQTCPSTTSTRLTHRLHRRHQGHLPRQLQEDLGPVHHRLYCDPKLLASKTGNDAVAEFVGKKAVFYQNGTWAYNDVKDLGDDNLGMLPIYIGAEGEENQGLCTGSENFWCVNNTSSDEDIQATLDFLYWCVTSEAGTSAMADKMGFVIPFKAAKDSTNPLIGIANDYVAEGKTSVDWCFSTMPSEEWKNGVGSALTAYAAGTGSWDNVSPPLWTAGPRSTSWPTAKRSPSSAIAG